MTVPSIFMHRAEIDGPGVTWSFRSGAPTWRPRINDRDLYVGAAELDPFPGYTHNWNAVREAVLHIGYYFRPDWDVHIWVADREETGRTNGFSSVDVPFHCTVPQCDPGCEKQDHRRPTGVIFLSGKRTPPHPALTRYLVAHEMGHNVEWMLEVERGEKPYDGKLIEEYARIRGLHGATHHGDGGRWHNSAHEIFACDFRILICELETEFWPHPGIPRPEECELIREWWEKALDRRRL